MFSLRDFKWEQIIDVRIVSYRITNHSPKDWYFKGHSFEEIYRISGKLKIIIRQVTKLDKLCFSWSLQMFIEDDCDEK